MSANRIGIFGGTFDPIHIGHLAVAERACDELGVERVVFVPALRPPHKPHRTISPIEDRLHMLELAIAGNSRFSWSDVDLHPDEPSYTVRMLERLGAEYPGAELYFIIGGDSLRDFDSWYQPDEILRLATLAVADRPGIQVDESIYHALPGLREKVVRFAAPLLEVSSTALRERVGANKSIRYLVSEPVYRYIKERELYRRDSVLPDDGG
ncbi:MAG TPA: nicotinate-nucleotide adenylyltransferase [Thermomicrobiales bacterium]|nr:nicotinate-nucleotide adenylyltransferase [Thermomicrobiales bacterium]